MKHKTIARKKSEKKEIKHVIIYAQNFHDIHGNEEALINLNNCVRIIKKQDAEVLFEKVDAKHILTLKDDKKVFSLATPYLKASTKFLDIEVKKTKSGAFRLLVSNGGGMPAKETRVVLHAFNTLEDREKFYNEKIKQIKITYAALKNVDLKKLSLSQFKKVERHLLSKKKQVEEQEMSM